MKKRWIILLFLTGVGIILFPHIAERVNNFRQSNQAEEFNQKIAGKEEEEIDKELEKIKDCYSKFFYNDQGIHDPFEESNLKLNDFMKCLEIEEDAVFASIEIPKLELLIPIYLGSTAEILSKGVGHVEGSSLPLGGDSTHTVLSAHRGMAIKAMFRDIDQLYEGDEFYIHGNTGTLKYRVTRQRVIYPDETSSLNVEEGKDMVTLLTCHPYRHNYQRLLIHAERFEEEDEGKLVEVGEDIVKKGNR